jgi:hypothetical protein
MKQRFSYEYMTLAIEDAEGDLDGYGIFDAKRGHGEGMQLAVAVDRDAAELIVAALNGAEAPSTTVVGEAGLLEIEREGSI